MRMQTYQPTNKKQTNKQTNSYLMFSHGKVMFNFKIAVFIIWQTMELDPTRQKGR